MSIVSSLRLMCSIGLASMVCAQVAALGCAKGTITETSGSGGQGGGAADSSASSGNASSSSSGSGGPCSSGQTQICYTGDPSTKGIGACTTGTQICSAQGMWGPCVGEGKPSAETCDNIDNDCNGMVDDALPPQTCGVGACAATAPACMNGQPGPCTPGSPSPEACDGIDNDCNGIVDDGLGTTSCGVGPCAVTVQNCMNGQPQQCVPLPAMPEVCDGIDNNCDGIIDDGNPGGGQACSTGLLGVCAAGTKACTNGAIVCNQNVQPSSEVCDTFDNNCNGLVDDNCVAQVCGNGILEPGETCDDGNNVTNDACTNMCGLGPIAVFGNGKTNAVAGLTAIPEVFSQPAGAQWGVPSSVGIIITSNDGGLGPHPDYNAHLNAGAHVLVIGGTMDAAYTTWIGGYVATDGTSSWHQSSACTSDWNKVGVHAITQFMPAAFEFTNISSSYHMLHFAAVQPANTSLLGVSCEGASKYILVTRRYPTGGTFTYIPLDIGNYSDAGTQTSFVVPFLKGYLKYVRSPH